MEDKKLNKNRQKKEQIVAKLSEKLGKAKGLVFTNYQGMTHKQLEQLKKALKKVDAELVVAKNTLLNLALQSKSTTSTTGITGTTGNKKARDTRGTFDTRDTSLDGPTAALFAYSDIVLPLKELARTIKALNLPSIKFGILSRGAGSDSAREGTFLNAEQVLRLSALPTREVLLAQLLGQMKAPIQGLHWALSWNMVRLVMTLNAIQKTKA